MGKLRAWAFYKGHPLPPPGSFRERLVTALMIRERNEKIAFARLITQACTIGTGVSSERVDEILEEYREEVTQDRYNLGYETARQRRALRRSREALEMSRRMTRLEDMTVTDEEFEEALNARSK